MLGSATGLSTGPIRWSLAPSQPLCVLPRLTHNTYQRASDVSPHKSPIRAHAAASEVTTTTAAPPSTANAFAPPPISMPANIDPVIRYFRDMYPTADSNVSRLRVKVTRALEALQTIDPSCTALSLEADILPKAELLDALSPGLAWKVFSRYPEEFAHPDATDYWRIMAALLYNGGFSPDAIGQLFNRHICLFARTVQEPYNMRQLFDWLRVDLGLSQSDVVKLVDQFPLLLQTHVDDVLRPRVEYITTLAGSKTAAITAIRRQPTLLGIDTSYYQTKVEYLEGLGLASRDIARLFVSQPAVFTCRIEETLQPVIDCLREELSPIENDENDTTNAAADVDMDMDDLLRRLIASGGVLTRTPAVLRRRLKLWQTLGMDRSMLRQALRRCPRLLVYAIDEPKYRQKLQFLYEEMAIEPSALVVFPQYVSYSLAGRIAPRVAVAKALTGSIPRLGTLALKDEAFCKEIGVSPEDFCEFVANWAKSDDAKRWASAAEK